MSRSSGRSTGSSHVRCPSSTRRRYSPTGRATASRMMLNTANCNQPLADMSEFLRIKQRNRQVSEQKNGKDQCDRGDQVHGLPQFLAGLHVEEGDGEKQRGEEQHGGVLHSGAPTPVAGKDAGSGHPVAPFLRSLKSLMSKSFEYQKGKIKKR